MGERARAICGSRRLTGAAGGYEGTGEQVARRGLKAADFVQAGAWQWFALEGDWPGAPNLMETRVLWHGKVGLEVDRVVAFGVK
jgi:hypothetical protein